MIQVQAYLLQTEALVTQNMVAFLLVSKGKVSKIIKKD